MGYAHRPSLTGFITQLKKPANGKADESQAGTSTEEPQNGEESKEEVPQDIFDLYEKLDRDEEDEEEEGAMKTVSFEVKQENVEDVQKRCVAFIIVPQYIYIYNPGPCIPLPRCIRVLLLLAVCSHFAENVGWMLNQRCLLQFSHADKCG